MKMRTMMAAAGALALSAMTAQAGVLVFTDSFDNGTATQIAGESPSYWAHTTDTSNPNFSYLTQETGGQLTMAVSRTSNGGQANQSLRSASLDSSTNFWAGAKTFRGSEMSLVRPSTTPGGSWDGSFYFNVYSQATLGVNSAIGFRLRSDGQLSMGINQHTGSGYGTNGSIKLVNNVVMGSSQANLKGFELTLDGSSGQLVYSIRIQYAGTNSNDANADGWIDASDFSKNAALATMSGTLGAAETTALMNYWLAENGSGTTSASAKGAMELSVRETSSGVAGNPMVTTTFTIGQLDVSAVPEPASLALMAIGAGAIGLRRR